ncbi:DUF5937 family protein [Kibdelosporangium lantanae]
MALGPVGAQHVRLAISPLEEVLQAIRVIHRPGRSPVHARWAISHQAAVDVPELAELTALVTGDTYFPDFLTPPYESVDAQLAAITEAPLDRVRLEIEMATGTSWYGDPRPLLAAQVRTCWDRLLAPIWDRLHDVLDADIDHRARQFREGGLVAVLTGLSPGVRVDGPRILLPTVHSGHLDLDARGLRLVPSVFATRIGLMTPEPALIYPARGAATLWEDVPGRPGDPLADVLGRTKAWLMRALGEPANTAALARRSGMAASTVNEHLTALVAAGLARRRRIGRRVVYRRSSLGDELVSSAS